MPGTRHKLLDDTSRDSVRAAVREAERGTRGELVVYVVDRSEDYREPYWKGALGGALLGVLGLLAFRDLAGWWYGPDASWSLAAAGLGAFVGSLLARTPVLARALVTEPVLERRVARHAAAIFVDSDVSSTRERSGVLILISLFERRVAVLADRGLAKLVAHSEWVAIADALARELRAHRGAEAVAEAVRACGELLRRALPTSGRAEADPNELANDLRTPPAGDAP